MTRNEIINLAAQISTKLFTNEDDGRIAKELILQSSDGEKIKELPQGHVIDIIAECLERAEFLNYRIVEDVSVDI